ncbi:MAG: glycerol-3-phosphate dehydrogenase [Rhodobiaceae bacterium]|nr:glycerol-3-phosphate dehydrogenase [Rhodobiaceae bacterium]
MPGAQAFDIFVIGGGINGCGIARDAAGRGYSVFLAEKDDLASGTSSTSTKLVHGGLRYLEYYEFRLVQEALAEREVLWGIAPHIIKPLRFVLPHHKGLRPAWLLRLGLFLYDHLGGRKLLPGTSTVDMRTDPVGAPLKPMFVKGFEYSDCWADDSRLVVLNACDAAARGAVIRTRARLASAVREGGMWTLEVEDTRTGARETVTARLLVNAAGPWVDAALSEAFGRNDVRNVRLVQGSHVVVKRLFDHDKCYIFQNSDGRIIFAIPYEDDFTLVGTTDREYAGSLDDIAISSDEIDYLCSAASEYFKAPIKPADVVWSFSGVRPLYDDGASKAQEITRDYVIKSEGGGDTAPLLNLFGGKLTTYRRLGEAALKRIEGFLGAKSGSWTKTAPLPGGGFAPTAFGAELDRLKRDYPFLNAVHARRLMRLYGLTARDILGDAKSLDDLGQCFGADLYEAEVRHLVDNEFAQTAEDILWRRTKRGLRLTAAEAGALDAYLKAGPGAASAATG